MSLFLIFNGFCRSFLRCATKLYAVLFLVCLVSTSKGQEVFDLFEGAFRLTDSLPGRVTFEYRVKNDDTLKNGRFVFEHFQERYHETDSIHGLVLEGCFKDNVKDGDWSYSSKQFAITGGAQASGHRVEYQASGTEFLANAHFTDGRANGDYEIMIRNIVSSAPTDTLFYTKGQYHHGQISGRITGFTPDLRVSGQFDPEGFPDGDWVFTHISEKGDEIREIRRYDRGFFSKHYYHVNERLLEIRHVGFDTLARSGRGLLTRLPATPTYFRALDYTSVVMDTTGRWSMVSPDNFQKTVTRTNAFLERVFTRPASYYSHSVWKSVEGSERIPPVRIKIRKFAFSEKERLLNRDNEKLLLETKSLIKDFFGNPNIQLSRFTSKDLSFYYRIFEIYLDRLRRITPVITFLADEASEYVDHDAILDHHAIRMQYPEMVVHEYKDILNRDPHVFPPGLDVFRPGPINNHLTDVFQDVSSIVNKVESILDGYRAQSDLTDKERNLVSLRDSVIRTFFAEEEGREHNQLQMGIRDSVKVFIEDSFRNYAGLNTYERLGAVAELEGCYQQYLNLYKVLGGFQERLFQLDKDYTRTVWNPYTFTHMEERVKERVYTAFDEHVLPRVWDNFVTGLSCEGLSTKLSQHGALLDRMSELRLEDTKELERQIRRSRSDPGAFPRILGFQYDMQTGTNSSQINQSR